jgi:hypothetical protein
MAMILGRRIAVLVVTALMALKARRRLALIILGCLLATIALQIPMTMKQARAQISLLTKDQIGAQARPDLSFLNRTPTYTYHVAENGSDTNGLGTQASPWATIGKAAKTLKKGQAVHVHTGTYEECVTTVNPGTSEHPIWLKAAPGENVVITKGGSSCVKSPPTEEKYPFVRITQPYWIVDGFEIDAGKTFAQAVRFYGTNHAVAQNIDAHNGIGPNAIWFYNSQDAALLNSKVHEYRWNPGGSDNSTGVQVSQYSERILVQGNNSWGHTGDDFLCSDGDVGFVNGDDPTDITIEGNRYGNTHPHPPPPGGIHRTKTDENAVDIKTCNNVTVHANKMFGFRPVGTAPGGAALVAHMQAHRVLIEDNRFWDNGLAASLGSASGCCLGLGSVVFRRNLVFESTTQSGGWGRGVRIGTTPDPKAVDPPPLRFEAYHNTFHKIPKEAMLLGDNGVVNRAVLINNIVADAGSAIKIIPQNVQNFTSDRNLFWKAPLPPMWNYDKDSFIDENPQFVANPSNNDYYTEPGSKARNNALPEPLAVDPGHGPSSYCHMGPDIGFLESCFT